MGRRLELDLLPEMVPLTELELPEPQKGGNCTSDITSL